MHPHTYYIACSYGALALAIVWELWSLRRLRAASLRKVFDEQMLEHESPHDAAASSEPAPASTTPRSPAPLSTRQPGISSP